MPKVTELYAWVVEDTGPDDEGVPAFRGPDDTFMPMMGADMERAKQLRPVVEQMARATGKSFRLVRSVGTLEEVEVVKGGEMP